MFSRSPTKWVTILVSFLRASLASQKELTNFSSGSASDKKRRSSDCFDSAAKKFAMELISFGRAARMEADVPSRRVNRPDPGASCVGIGTK
jgi:hypothetical protein